LTLLLTLLFAAPASAEPMVIDAGASPVRIAVVGATRKPGADWQGTGLVQEVARWDPEVLLMTGGYLVRSSKREWGDFMERWGELTPICVAPPDAAARRGDAKLKRWQQVTGRHVNPLPPEATWSLVNVTTDGARWRIVVLDPAPEALGRAGWLDQRSWLPKAVTGDEYDHLIVVLPSPLATLAQAPDAGRATQELLDIIAENAHPLRLLTVVAGGTGSNEALLHGGSFGALHINAGNSGIPATDLDRWGSASAGSVGELALAQGFDAALQRAWIDRIGSPVPNTYDGSQLPVTGWWQLELLGKDLSVRFQLADANGVSQQVYGIRYTRTFGWVAEQ
jgi:hypothetical protein